MPLKMESNPGLSCAGGPYLRNDILSSLAPHVRYHCMLFVDGALMLPVWDLLSATTVIQKAKLVWLIALVRLGCALLFPVYEDGEILDIGIAIPRVVYVYA